MLRARVATATVLLGVFLSAMFLLTTRQFSFLVGMVVAVGAFEWAALAKAPGTLRLAFSALCTGIFVLLIWSGQAIGFLRPEMAVLYAFVTAFWILGVPVWLFYGARFGSPATALAVGLLVVVPAGLSVISLHSAGPEVLLMLTALVWIADIAAYFTGRAFGTRKLAPTISPGKTWEGVAGALLATMIYATICAMIWPRLGAFVRGWEWVPYLAISSLLCAVSIVGDLFESAVKRQAAVKDSGTLLPGHGGVLDRIDSITSALPVAALLIYMIAGGV